MPLKEVLKRIKLSEQNISMILGALVIIIIGLLLFNYFRGSARPQLPTAETPTQPQQITLNEEGGKQVPQGLPTTHKVAKGERLWDIAILYYGSGYNWVDIAKENKLKSPDHLLVGQVLSIPKVAVREPIKKLAAQPQKQITEERYTVVKGDNLWKIAVRAYGDGYKWPQIAQANKLVNPNLIHPGNVLILPR